jgi:hypothetical protein
VGCQGCLLRLGIDPDETIDKAPAGFLLLALFAHRSDSRQPFPKARKPRPEVSPGAVLRHDGTGSARHAAATTRGKRKPLLFRRRADGVRTAAEQPGNDWIRKQSVHDATPGTSSSIIPRISDLRSGLSAMYAAMRSPFSM